MFIPEKYKNYFSTVLVDPPWRFTNSSGKISPEHKRLHRYNTMGISGIIDLPVADLMQEESHCYIWCPAAMLQEGLTVLRMWGFTYKTTIVWYKIRKDGGPDGRGCGFYFRLVTEFVLFGIRGKIRTLKPGRTQTNIIISRKREHSRKPNELYDIIESCSSGPYVELFARERRANWVSWGDQLPHSTRLE